VIVVRGKVIVVLALLLAATTLLGLASCGGADPEGIVTVVQIAPAGMEDALAAGEIDAFLAWEPFPAKAVAAGTGHYLVQSGEIWPDHPCCILAVSQEGADARTEEALLWVHAKATRFLVAQARQEEVLDYGVELASEPRAIVSEALSHMSFSPTDPLPGLRKIAEDLKGLGLLPSDTGEAFWRGFGRTDRLAAVSERLQADPTWVPAAGPGELRLGYIAKDLHQLALYVGVKERLFEKVGLVPGRNLSLRPYPNGVAIMQAFSAGELDAAYLGAVPALLKSVNDRVPIAVVAGANQEGSALVTKAGIDRVEDLAGLRVAVPQVGTVQYVLLLVLLERHGLKFRLG